MDSREYVPAYSGVLYRFALLTLGQREAAAQAVSGACAAVWAKLRGRESQSDTELLLLRELHQRLIQQQEGSYQAQEVAASFPAAGRESSQLIHSLAALSQPERALLALRFGCGLSHGRTAAALRLSTGQTGARLAALTEKLTWTAAAPQ